MRIKFQHSLDELKERLLVMAGLAEQAIQRAITGYATRDAAMCELVIASEPAINQLERDIDQMAGDLLATEQPMATDLRFIIAVLRINGDLERVGDQAVNIARRAQEMMDMPDAELPVDIPRLGSLAGAMVRSALQAFIEGDSESARLVLLLDDQVDAMNSSTFKVLSALIQEKPDYVDQALSTLIIAKNLERIGDHATNIAEDVIFWVSGADVRHGVAPTNTFQSSAA